MSASQGNYDPASGDQTSPYPAATRFHNLARRDPTPEEIEAVTSQCKAELEAAGLKTYNFGHLLNERAEVPSKCVGHLSGWTFERAWHYWRAKGPGIPPEIAERLHATHGRDVRVDGHCGCPSPLEWARGFAIGSYHIDTAEGLKALADTLRSIWDEDAARPEQTASASSRADLKDLKPQSPNTGTVNTPAVSSVEGASATATTSAPDSELPQTDGFSRTRL